MEVKKVICIQCHNACRLAATVDGNHLISVEPDKEFPGTKSSYSITKACPRRRNAIEYLYHPARLNWFRKSGNHHSGRFRTLFPKCEV